jgi:uncharacterized membrane protein required for colicin V production
MNSVDVALLTLFGVCALRGYWRGFFRESFGLVALVAAVAAAFQFAASVTAVVEPYVRLPPQWQAGVAFVGVFVVVYAAVNLVGVVVDRVGGDTRLGPAIRVSGAAVGAAKAAAGAAFVLLSVHLLPVAPGLDSRLMTSTIGRPLVSLAGNVIRYGLQASPPSTPQDKT